MTTITLNKAEIALLLRALDTTQGRIVEKLILNQSSPSGIGKSTFLTFSDGPKIDLTDYDAW